MSSHHLYSVWNLRKNFSNFFFLGHVTDLSAPSQTVVKESGTPSDLQLGQNPAQTETHSSRSANVDITSSAESQKVTTDTPNTIMYPNAPYRPLTMEKPVSGTHSEALLNLALSRAAAESAGTLHTDLNNTGSRIQY